MHRDIHFWYTTLARGVVALFFGSAIWFVPEMAASLLLLPMAVSISVLGLSAYGVVDSSFVLLSSTMARPRRAAFALRVQGMVGIAVGVLLFAGVYEQVRLEWFFLLAAVQALSVGATEVVVARHTANHAKTIWNYGAAAIAFCFGCAFLVCFRLADSLTAREICLFIYGYLLGFGFFECLTALRMLHSSHAARRRLAEPARAALIECVMEGKKA